MLTVASAVNISRSQFVLHTPQRKFKYRKLAQDRRVIHAQQETLLNLK